MCVCVYFVTFFVCVHPEWIDKTNRRKWPFVIPQLDSQRALGAIWCPTLFHFLFNQRIRRSRGKANSITYLFWSSFFLLPFLRIGRTKGNCAEPIVGPSISYHQRDREPNGLATCPSTKDVKLIRYVSISSTIIGYIRKEKGLKEHSSYRYFGPSSRCQTLFVICLLGNNVCPSCWLHCCGRVLAWPSKIGLHF